MSHVYALRVRFSDVDVYGHVNNVKYFEYYQEARTRMMAALRGVPAGADWPFPVVVARTDVDYRRPILFRPEEYVVESVITRIGRSSFTVDSEIKDEHQVLSRASVVLVRYDLEAQRPQPLSTEERASLETLLAPDAGA